MVERLLGGVAPQLMVTDPPYGVSFMRRNRHDPRDVAQGATLQEIRIKNDHRASWSRSYELSGAPVAYVWFSSILGDVVYQSLRDANYQIRQQVVWVKNVMVLGRAAYHWKHEAAAYAVRVDSTAEWKGDRKQTTVWEESIVPPKQRIHPTQKPLGLWRRPILNHTVSGDGIYDPFCGSGTVFMAAEETGRVAFGIELEPVACMKIFERYAAETGTEPVLVENVFKHKAKRA